MNFQKSSYNVFPASFSGIPWGIAMPAGQGTSFHSGATIEASAHSYPAASNSSHGMARKFTRRGQPKPRERELDPTEDIPTTAANAMVRCEWGICKKMFRAGEWMTHVKTGEHLVEMHATRDKAGQVQCLWKGCTVRLMPGSMSKHVRAQHVGTYEFHCKHCGRTARGDSYTATHGLARDCPMRPSQASATTSPSESPVWTPSGSSMSSRQSHRYSPYHRSSASSSDGGERLRHLHQLGSDALATSRTAGPSSKPSVLKPLPILQPQPIRPLRLDAFDLFSPPPLRVPDAPPVPSPPTAGPEPSPLDESPALPQPEPRDPAVLDVFDVDMSDFCHLIAGTTGFDPSFVFDPDAPW
ncbi:hypothetical protein LXA43DRAFT_1060779 [Ganoderma leucocontextum]|nr:hypothetical protein LXA43DRAFT_1060779 [Ganoderma leucocontextum]